MNQTNAFASSSAANVLLVDDQPDLLSTLLRALRAEELGSAVRFEAYSQPHSSIGRVKSIKPEVVVLDLCLDTARGVHSGFELLRDILSVDSSVRIIVLTGHASVQHGIHALRLGAANFVEKPPHIPHLASLIRDGITQARLRRELMNSNTTSMLSGCESIIGHSASTQRLREEISYAAQCSQPVLLTGETGTGKGLCAQVIHRLSKRGGAQLVRYQATFGSPDLVSSDLFGHHKGAFTGATYDRPGLLQQAHQGTLFLDEIDELPPQIQVMLLGVLQEKRFRRIGRNTEEVSDFRLISATNANLEGVLSSGKMRRDLFHRIAHLTIHLAPLRERSEDIEGLTLSHLAALREKENLPISAIEPAALHLLQRHNWPGNVRELHAVIEGAAYRAQHGGRSVISPKDITSALPRAAAESSLLYEQVQVYKRALVKQAITRNAGNHTEASRALGINRSTLHRIMGSE